MTGPERTPRAVARTDAWQASADWARLDRGVRKRPAGRTLGRLANLAAGRAASQSAGGGSSKRVGAREKRTAVAQAGAINAQKNVMTPTADQQVLVFVRPR